MDGILYDSMPKHALAWGMMCDREGIKYEPNEFFAYEGRTGASTIDILYRRMYGRNASEEEHKRLYGYKTEYFASMPDVDIMPGAQESVSAVLSYSALPVLVTGSGQNTLLKRLDNDFPAAFLAEYRVTAHDVSFGKPNPEPFLRGLEKAGVKCTEAVGIDNAPLGVESSSRAGIFTIGVRTGPLAPGSLLASGADIEINSMHECAFLLRHLLNR